MKIERIDSRAKGELGRRRMLSLAAAAVLTVALCTAARAAEPPSFFPTPQKAQWLGEASSAKSFTIKADASVPYSTVREYGSRLREWGFDEKEGGLVFTLAELPPKDCENVAPAPYQKKSILEFSELQVYFLKVGDGAVDVKACGEDGFFYALMTFKNLIKDKDKGITIQKADIADWPVFGVRGLFEGAYGRWDLDGRLRVLDWMGENKLNSFIYGPKGDPKMRRSWREPYSDLELFGFKRMLQAAERNHIQFGYVIGPSQGVEYGSDDDYAVLLKKTRQLQSLGVKYFIIAFDDSLGMMYNAKDRARFANLGEAEAFLANKLYDGLTAYDKEVILVIVPEIYAGVHPMDYTNSLKSKLRPEILIGWTGSQIGAPKIDADSLKKFVDFYGRMPSLGDNWGSIYPLLGRSPEIHKFTTQYTMNPYNLFGEIPIPGISSQSEPDMARIQCASLAEFAWNPYAHDPDKVIDTLSKMYYAENARDIFKMLMYKDLFAYRGYYVLDTDYVTPLEAPWLKLAANPDEKELRNLTDKTTASLELMAKNIGLAQSGCNNPSIGKSMALRATILPKYLDSLIAVLKNIGGALDKKDKALQKQGIESFLNALKEAK